MRCETLYGAVSFPQTSYYTTYFSDVPAYSMRFPPLALSHNACLLVQAKNSQSAAPSKTTLGQRNELIRTTKCATWADEDIHN